MKIKGGYYIKARCIQDSEIAISPPHTRELWDWLIKEAGHKEYAKYGITLERGCCLRTYSDMQDGLKWRVGYRWETYSTHQIETALKMLVTASMITKTRTRHGLLVTICNYKRYQNPENYVNHYDNQTDNQNDNQNDNQTYINKNKEVKRKKEHSRFAPPLLTAVKQYINEKKYEVDANNFVDFYSSKGWMIGKNKMKDWKAAVRTWHRKNAPQKTFVDPMKGKDML